MLIALQKNARTTLAVRAEIAASSESPAVRAERYGITERQPTNGRAYRLC